MQCINSSKKCTNKKVRHRLYNAIGWYESSTYNSMRKHTLRNFLFVPVDV